MSLTLVGSLSRDYLNRQLMSACIWVAARKSVLQHYSANADYRQHQQTHEENMNELQIRKTDYIATNALLPDT